MFMKYLFCFPEYKKRIFSQLINSKMVGYHAVVHKVKLIMYWYRSANWRVWGAGGSGACPIFQ